MNIVSEIEKQISRIKGNTTEIIDYLSKQNRSDLVDKIVKEKSVKLFDLKIKSLKDLKMAVIMDGFTLESYRPECHLLELVPDNWKKQMEDFQPHLLFIESAWKGKDDLWYRKIDRRSQEVYELTEYCHENNIPVIFWNKEDPIYTTSFMTTASLADVVFTTDIDCIQRYKAELGHDRVYHLHFAAQPAIHNPIEKYERKDKFCFAGAYYHKYKKRAEVFDKFSEIFIKTKGFDIYDRNYQNARPEHAFPEQYNQYILGSLPSSQIDVAYKGYVYGINMNSVQQSQTMFARRVFEMMASNTITVGNYSRGVKNYFGDLTICTDDEKTMEAYLQEYCNNSNIYRKYRLAGLRNVLSYHLYEDRLDYIVSKVFGISLKHKPIVSLVSRCANHEDCQRIISIFDKQTYDSKRLIIIGDNIEVKREDVLVYSEEQAQKEMCIIENVDYYAYISLNDYYGKNYIKDLVLACRYGVFNGVGKVAFYENGENISLKNENLAYKMSDSLISQRCILSKTILKETTLMDLCRSDFEWQNELFFAIDEFNYCANYNDDICKTVDDLSITDCGISMSKIEEIAEGISAAECDNLDAKVLTGNALQKQFVSARGVSFKLQADNLNIVSELEEDKHEYFFSKDYYSLDEYKSIGKFQIKFKTEGVLDCICVCVYYDGDKNKIQPQYPAANSVVELQIPDNAKFFKIGFRPKGKGSYLVHEIIWGDSIAPAEDRGCYLSRSGVLVMSNQYPTPDALYRNMFVHKRMTSYKKSGYVFDVMRMNTQVHDEYREFEGINVTDGGPDMLASILESGHIHTVCVHFLDELMWNVLKDYVDKIRILVWLHGSEIQPWWRREYNYSTEAELARAKEESDVRMKFWAGIFGNIEKYPNLYFIFVSQYFADEIFEDNKIVLDKEKYCIVHNCIDTEMFNYIPKDAEQRKKLLSIRPYASAKYANDLTVKCILELSKKPYFKDLQIRLMGSGELFESTLKPLTKYSNVVIEKRFLRQEEIAELHKEYGIFITPTRMDAQGVSRDEAMSSGLVPVTNAVTAIPEFVDEECGILAPGEDYLAMAEGIDKLYNNPDEFVKLSANAAARVRRQTSKEYTIDKEIALICNEL